MSDLDNELPELKIPEDLRYPSEYKSYFSELIQKTLKEYSIALEARKKGYDPSLRPEIALAYDLASRVEAMVGPKGIARRIRALQKEGKELEEIAIIVAREIATGKYDLNTTDPEKIAEQALRTALAIITNGVVAAPLEGIVTVKIRPSKHLAVYYAGPIRSAGGTETAMSVLLADIIRKSMGLQKYVASEKEIGRMIEEVFLYDRKHHLQHRPNREEIIFAMRNLPVEINGEGTDEEVQIHRKVPNVETPRIRGGAVLVLNDGIILKAKKLLKIVKKYNIEGWSWLEKLLEVNKSNTEKKEQETIDDKKSRIKPNPAYLGEVVVGRPIFSSPMRTGGFRLRYGRSRNTGLAAVGIHPVTMYLLDEFLAVGTQIKPERPGKGAIVMPVDGIDPPLVLLDDGTVLQLDTVELFKKIKNRIKRVLFLGDMLVAIGEFLENNHTIVPSPIVEEWWRQELKAKSNIKDINAIEKMMLEDPLMMIRKCQELNIPWHPRYTYFWRNISKEELLAILNEIKTRGFISSNHKSILEKLFIPHKVDNEKIILDKRDFLVLQYITREYIDRIEKTKSAINALDALRLVGLNIYDKYTLFIGARMGRPEKAKPRKMKPDVHVLFPMGEAGAKTRSLMRVLNKYKEFKIEAAARLCPKCKRITFYPSCPKCGTRTIPIYICQNCGFYSEKPFNKCPKCGSTKIEPFKTYTINFKQMFLEIEKKHGISPPKDLRCVKGLISQKKTPEYLAKGILRAKYDLSVFRDGTIRFDGTDIPLTHFKPEEIDADIDTLKKLGYQRDIEGKPLTKPSQILELKVQDIIINEEAAEYLFRVTKFIDDLLQYVYGLPPYYQLRDKKDLIGHLVIGLAPHTSAGIIGRIIGFTKIRGIIAHPYWHAAKRRNCDGDEDAIMLLLDGLLNFSKEFLPKSRGGQMDAPLIVTVILNPLEVDSEVYNMDTMKVIPLEFYRKSQEYPEPSEIEELIDNVEKRLNTPQQYVNLHFSISTSRLDMGPKETAYVKAKNMLDKLQRQINLMKKIDAIDYPNAIGKILESHILRDILGNLRSFGTQTFKCTNCHRTIRRIPLNGKCPYCGHNLKPSVYRNMVLKYFGIAQEIIKSLDPLDFKAQQFNRFIHTDFKILGSTISSPTNILEFMDNNQRQAPIENVKIVIKKIDLKNFFE